MSYSLPPLFSFVLLQLACHLSLCNAGPNLLPRSATTTTVGIETVTVTSLLPVPSGQLDSSYINYTDFIAAVLNSTNFYRYEHGAPMVTWNDSLAAFSANYASRCAAFAHSGRAGVGENIVAGVGGPFAVNVAIDLFGDERDKYDFDSPGFSEATGHFSQLVWKGTTTTGCGAAYCGQPDNGLPGVFMVCQYHPQGNIVDGTNEYYRENVQHQLNNGEGYVPDQIKVAYQGGATETATNTLGPKATGSNMMGEAIGVVEQSPRRMFWTIIATLLAFALAGGMI